MNKINEFKKQPYATIEQKSPEWLKLRNNYITASSVYKLFEKNDEYLQYIKEKASGISSFKGNEATYFGEVFEPVAREVYMYLTGEHVEEFGLIVNPDLPYCAVSPDGVTESDRLLEIKCPYSRTITGVIPHHYFHQIQLQLAVCDCDECDFLECKFTEISEDEFKSIRQDKSKFICVVKTFNDNTDSPCEIIPHSQHIVKCYMTGQPSTVTNKSTFSRYKHYAQIPRVVKTITDIPDNGYWIKHSNTTYYKLEFISLQTVNRNIDWVNIHRKELNETIPLVKSIRDDPKVLNTIKIDDECDF